MTKTQKEVTEMLVLCCLLIVLCLILLVSPVRILWLDADNFIPLYAIAAMIIISIFSSLVFGFSVQHRSTFFMILCFGVGFLATATLMVYEIAVTAILLGIKFLIFPWVIK